MSVREAYRALEELGVVTIRRGADGGAFIVEPGHVAIQESLSLMLRLGRTSSQELSEAWTIEPTIARLAARNAHANDIARLKGVLEREEAAVASHAYAGHDWLRFQRAVAKCARNLPLIALTNSLADLTREAISSSDAWPISREHTCRAHRAIFEAIAHHDEDTAYQLMRQHMVSVQNGFAAVQPSGRRHTERLTGGTSTGGAAHLRLPA